MRKGRQEREDRQRIFCLGRRICQQQRGALDCNAEQGRHHHLPWAATRWPKCSESKTPLRSSRSWRPFLMTGPLGKAPQSRTPTAEVPPHTSCPHSRKATATPSRVGLMLVKKPLWASRRRV